MTEISRRLRGARELAGLSIEDLAATTKIRRAVLQAIELGEFDRLPGEFYTRAFLKAYAREVHLSPDEIVHEYDLSRPGPQPQPELHEIVASREQARQAQQAAPTDRAPRSVTEPSWPLILSTSPGARATVAIAATVLLLITLVRNRPADERPHEPGAVGTSGVVEAAAPRAVASPPAAAAPDKLILQIHPTGPTWVTGAADGKRVLYRLLSPGEHITVEARDDLSFRIGNAVAFTYAINGVPGKSLGGPDEIREFRITRENYRTFGR